jgi:cation-transporting ATPase E
VAGKYYQSLDYGVIVAVPPLREFFELTLPRWWDYQLVAAIAAGWALMLCIVWRNRVFEKVFTLDGM